MIYAGLARNENERKLALRLAATSFRMSEDREDSAFFRKTLMLREHPGFTEDSSIVVCASDGSVVGSAFLIERALPLRDKILRAVFISSISIAEKVRGQGLSYFLMEAAIEASRVRGIDVAMLIARRAVDGFYTRFGFWGLSQYSKVTFDLVTLPKAKRPELSIKIFPAVDENLEICAALYTENYKNLIGHCERKPEMWRYILLKLPYLGLRFELVTIDGKIAGYVIHDGKGNIHEIATVSAEFSYETITLLEAFNLGVERVTLHVHPTHPFLKKLVGADISLILRECSYGGHMVKVLNPAAFLHEASDCDKNIQPLEFNETARLFSISSVTCFDSSRDIGLYSSFNIPLLDQI